MDSSIGGRKENDHDELERRMASLTPVEGYRLLHCPLPSIPLGLQRHILLRAFRACYNFWKDWKPYSKLSRVILLAWRPNWYCKSDGDFNKRPFFAVKTFLYSRHNALKVIGLEAPPFDRSLSSPSSPNSRTRRWSLWLENDCILKAQDRSWIFAYCKARNSMGRLAKPIYSKNKSCLALHFTYGQAIKVVLVV